MAKKQAGSSRAARIARAARVAPDAPRDDGWKRPPRTPEELHVWLSRWLGVGTPRRALVDGNSTPFEYLCFAFFGATGVASGVAPGGTSVDAPVDAVVWANRGGGKTFFGAVATLLDMLFKPGIEVRILGGSLEQSARMHAHLVQLLDRPAFAGEVRGRITDRRIAFKNGSRVELLAQSQASVRGTRVQKLRCDEVELFTPELWEAAQLATRSKRCGEVEVAGSIECLSTMHVPFGLMSRLVDEARQGRRALFRWSVLDVLGECDARRACRGEGARPDCALLPECAGRAKQRADPRADAGHVAIEDAVRLKRRVSGATWESEMLCRTPTRSDLVVPEFDAGEHVVGSTPGESPQEQEGLTWVAGMDFGFRAPTVVLWGVLEPGDESRRLWIVDERIEAGALLEEHVEALVRGRWPRPAWVGVDPAGRARHEQTGVSNVQVLRRAGLVVRAPSLPIQAGLGMVRARLRPADGSRPRLLIHSRCMGLIRALSTYHYPRDRPECLTPEKDGSDHAVDALRYLVSSLDRRFGGRVRGY